MIKKKHIKENHDSMWVYKACGVIILKNMNYTKLYKTDLKSNLRYK